MFHLYRPDLTPRRDIHNLVVVEYSLVTYYFMYMAVSSLYT